MNLYLLAAYCFTFATLGIILVKTILNYKISSANQNKK